jgi:hypothetical protein
MKQGKFITLFLGVSFFTSVLQAQESLSVEQLTQEIKELKQSLAEYKKKQDSNSNDIEELYDYTEHTETLVLEDKLKFGLGYKVNMDNFKKKLANGDSVKNNNVLSSKLMLNIKANITDNLKFYSRLSMYKYWGNGEVHPYSRYDNMQGRVPSVSTLFVERAYFNWFLNRDGKIPFALTIGRQPSADGPSQQFKDNTTRKATYSALLYDGASDGAVVTLNLSHILDNKGTYLRFGYAKGYLYTESQPDVSNAFVGPMDNELKDSDIYGVFFDTTLPTLKHSLVQVSFSKMYNVIANPLDTTDLNTNIGDFSIAGAMLEVKNIKDTHLDFFLHYGYSVGYSNGNNYSDYGSLLGSTTDHSNKYGHAVWTGARYALDEKQHFKIGAEYNHGSKNWVSFTQGSFDVYNKLATRGDVYEAYLMYVANRYTNIRLGFIAIDYKYSRSGFFVGESQKISTLDSEELDKLSSIYLKMSIHY